jgi:hypothetical protein
MYIVGDSFVIDEEEQPPTPTTMTLRDYLRETVERYWSSTSLRVRPMKAWAKDRGLIELVECRGSEVLKKHTWACPNCGYVHYDPDSNTNHIRIHNGRLIRLHPDNTDTKQTCHRCVENFDAFYCVKSRANYLNGPFHKAILRGGDYICIEVCGGQYAIHPDGNAVDISSTPGYHHGYRSWSRPRGSTKRLYGVELEILCSTRGDARQQVRKAATELGLAFEIDGSLDRDYGMEIVGPPMSYEEATNPDGVWCKFLGEIQGKATGWDAGTGYGMHVNLNAHAFTVTQLSKFVNFICSNSQLVQAVAGRTATQHCQPALAKDLGGLKSAIISHSRSASVRTLANHFHVGEGGRLRIPAATMNKYLACSIRGEDRVEVRCYRSTIRWDRFKRNIQFADSVHNYVCQASNQVYLEPIHYVRWMSTQQQQYPELCSFLYTRPAWGKHMPVPPSKKVLQYHELSNNDSESARLKPVARPVKKSAATVS